MKRIQSETIICAVLLLLVFALSLGLRVSLPWEEVFGGTTVKMTDNDAYFYMRLLDNLCAHFPLLGSYDPYNIFPAGRELSGQPLFMVYLMGFFAWLLGGGAPSPQAVDLVGAYFPAVLGALLVFPAFFIGRALYNKWAGLAAALLITLMPGEFLARTLLGNTDTHVLEIFLSTLFMLCLLLGAEKGRRLASFKAPEKGGIGRMTAWAALAGVCLGLYVASWAGAALFVLISLAWLTLQFISDHLRGISTLYAGVMGAIAYAVALAVTLPFPNIMSVTRTALVIALLCTIALCALSLAFSRYKLKRTYYPAAVAGTGLAAGVLLAVISPDTAGSMLSYARVMFIWNPLSPIAETQPLLMQDGSFTLALVWGNYTAGSLLALAGLAAVIYQSIKEGRPSMLMVSTWSIIMLLATLAMRRFAYYLAIDVAILGGSACWLILRSCGFRETAASVATSPAHGKKKETRKQRRRERAAAGEGRPNIGLMAAGAAAVLLLTIYPNTGPLPGGDRPFYDVSTRALFAPSDAWCEALAWLKEESPEPYGDAGYYYALYGDERRQADYSVLTWWDYGYWVTRSGHRVPVCNPGASLRGEEKFFSSQDPARATALLEGWKTQYVIVDDRMVNVQKRFGGITYAAGQPQSQYYDIYYVETEGRLSQALMYYPDYYRTLAVRLFCFGGEAYVPREAAVISWEPRPGPDGSTIRVITGLKMLNSYEDAAAFVAAQATGNWRIVGKDPLVSPVPLEALAGYSLVFSSSDRAGVGNADVSSVKVFKYNRGTTVHE